jgi:hypothetical protein
MVAADEPAAAERHRLSRRKRWPLWGLAVVDDIGAHPTTQSHLTTTPAIKTSCSRVRVDGSRRGSGQKEADHLGGIGIVVVLGHRRERRELAVAARCRRFESPDPLGDEVDAEGELGVLLLET